MISVSGVTKYFDGGIHALAPSDLKINTGEFVTVVGPSGCGKSTLLRIIAELIEPTEGIVTKPDDSMGAFVFQDAALLPWRNVQHNAELLIDGKVVGHVTTPAYSRRMGQSQALVHLIPSAAKPGTKLELKGPTIQCSATATPIPFVDPERKNLHVM